MSDRFRLPQVLPRQPKFWRPGRSLNLQMRVVAVSQSRKCL